MRSVPANTYNVLLNSPRDGVKVRDFVWIEAVGSAEAWGFYSGIDPAISLEVVSGSTGATVVREYFGAGALQSISEIPLTTGLNVFHTTINLSNIDARVNNMLRGFNIRNGRVEIHRGIIDPLTDQLADPPMVHFIGTVNKADPRTPAIGNQGSIQLTCTSITNELTRSNPAMFSDATISRRSGDRFCRYTEVMADVKLPWGADPQSDGAPSQRNGGNFL